MCDRNFFMRVCDTGEGQDLVRKVVACKAVNNLIDALAIILKL